MRAAARRAARFGAVGGTAMLYFCAVGMVGDFSARNLAGTWLTLGRVLLWTPAFVVGYAATKPRRGADRLEPLSAREAIAAGLVAGAAAGVVVDLGVAFVQLLGRSAVQNVLFQVNDALIGTVAFHRSTASGLILFTAVSAAFGFVGAALRLAQPSIRRVVVAGAAAVVSMGLLVRVVPTVLFELGVRSSWLYDPVRGGLTSLGTILSFVLGAAGTVGWRWWRERPAPRATRAAPSTDDPLGRPGRALRLVALGALGVVLLALPTFVGSIVSDTLGFVGIFLLLALGLNIIVGNAGLLNLGFVVFYVVGAYATALLTGGRPVTALGLAPPVLPFQINFYVAVWIVVAIAAVIGVLIAAPTVRLAGDYYAIVTLGFGAIASVLIQSDWTRGFTGGAQGITAVPPAPILGTDAGTPQRFYYLALAACILAVFVSYRLTYSRVGRAWNAMREDEQVAEAMGISVVRYKLLASAVGGALGALGGALFAVKLGSLTSQSFTVLASITALAVIILGGLGSIRGAVVGAVVLVGLPNLLSEFEQYRLSIYGAALIAIMLFRPQGLLPNVRVARELQEEERAQDAWVRARAEEGEAEPAPAAASESAS